MADNDYLNSVPGENRYIVGSIKPTPTMALRYNEGKPPVSYLLTFPNAIKGVADVCKYGEKKYERFNYLKGANVQQYVDCLLRHLTAFYNGEDLDPDSGNRHVDHVTWNALMLAEVMAWADNEELDDRP